MRAGEKGTFIIYMMGSELNSGARSEFESMKTLMLSSQKQKPEC